MELTAPQLASVVTVAKSAELAMPKRTSLPSMLPPDCVSGGVLVDAVQQRVGLRFGPVAGRGRRRTRARPSRRRRPSRASGEPIICRA